MPVKRTVAKSEAPRSTEPTIKRRGGMVTSSVMIGSNKAVTDPAPSTRESYGRKHTLCLEPNGEKGIHQRPWPGQRYCWCMCPSCWSPQGSVKPKKRRTVEETQQQQTRLKGRCICRHCPCQDEPNTYRPGSLLGFPTLTQGRGSR